MRGPLARCAGDDGARDAVIFGYFGGAVNVADGRYTYHRFPADLATQEIYQYTLMPTHIFDAVLAGGTGAGRAVGAASPSPRAPNC